MSCTVRITLEGLPEHVQEIADAIDAAVPGTLEWHNLAEIADGFDILLQGFVTREAPYGVRQVWLGNRTVV